MMDLQVWKQWHEEVLREAQRNRLAKALRKGRKGCAIRASSLAWELKRGASRLVKLLRFLKSGSQ